MAMYDLIVRSFARKQAEIGCAVRGYNGLPKNQNLFQSGSDINIKTFKIDV
jgi:hypothetical protein